MARVVLALLLAGCAGPALAARRPRCPAQQPRCRATDIDGLNEYPYIIDGVTLVLEYTDSGYFYFECSKNLTLDNPALPRFEQQLRVNKIRVANCPPPRGSYAEVFERVNVVALDSLKLINTGNLTGAHLAHLGDVPALELVQAALAESALAALPRLRRLLLDRVRLPPGELRRLPRGLRALQLVRVGADLTPAALAALPELRRVAVRDSRTVAVALGASVQELALELPAARVPSALSAQLQRLTVSGWAERRPAPWSACALRSLDARALAAEALPAGWLADCAELRELRVWRAPQLRALHATSLRGARRLRELTLSSTALSSLPPGLLDDAVELSLLDLSGNHLKELPGGLFAKTSCLQTLNLSRNRLSTDVFASLAAATSLTALNLSYNDLKDSCGGANDTVRGSSPLRGLTLLTELDLKRTNSRLICRDWRETMTLLKSLNLSSNNFTSVTYTDLVFRGVGNVSVDLSDNPLRSLQYSRRDYSRVLAGEVSRARVSLGGALACDCGAYWAARALRERPAHVALSAACARGPQLRAAEPDALLCAAPALCAAPCACAWRPAGPAGRARVLRVACERAGVARVAAALAPVLAAVRRAGQLPDHYDWQLLLAGNNISDLSVADLPNSLSVLDLRNNSLSVLSAQEVRALLAGAGRRVWLAGNPLRCACGDARALAALHAHHAALADYARLRCRSGQLLAAVSAEPCAALGAGAAAALLALAALLGAAALLGVLLHAGARRRLKAALHRRGWLAAEPDDAAAARYDVFVSHAHADERWVRDELVARLERGAAPYRVCVHYRDWAPGGWIPAQIAASVRASRRTVAVLSEPFLRSAWARAEFQQAHALALRSARPRLVAVLLAEPASLPLDATLRAFLAANTYVRWGDPWFWQKLYRALPHGPLTPLEPEPPDFAPAPGAEVKVCSEPSAACSPSAPADSTSSGSPASSSGSAPELSRLMPASCAPHYAGELNKLASARSVHV